MCLFIYSLFFRGFVAFNSVRQVIKKKKLLFICWLDSCISRLPTPDYECAFIFLDYPGCLFMLEVCQSVAVFQEGVSVLRSYPPLFPSLLVLLSTPPLCSFFLPTLSVTLLFLLRVPLLHLSIPFLSTDVPYFLLYLFIYLLVGGRWRPVHLRC